MVLTEAFASGTPVVASDIAGYRDVVRDGVDGDLVPVGDPAALGERLRSLALNPERRGRMAAACQGAERFAWPHVATEVMEVYGDALEVPRPEGRLARAAAGAGLRAVEPGERVPPRRLPSLEPEAPGEGRRRAARTLRRGLVGAGAAGGIGLAALALDRIGIERVGQAIVDATFVCADRFRADVRVDAGARGGVARDPEGRAGDRVRVRRRDAARER